MPDPFLHKLESLEVIVHAMANAVLYLGRRQETMSIASDALTVLEGKMAAFEAAVENAVSVATAAASFKAEVESDASRIQHLEAALEAATAKLAALQPPA